MPDPRTAPGPAADAQATSNPAADAAARAATTGADTPGPAPDAPADGPDHPAGTDAADAPRYAAGPPPESAMGRPWPTWKRLLVFAVCAVVVTATLVLILWMLEYTR